MDIHATIEANGHALFNLFQKGKWDEAGKLFAPGALIFSRYGKTAVIHKGMSYNDFKKAATNGPLAALGLPVYLNRRFTTFSYGFVEQHTSRLTINETPCDLAVALVAYCDPSTGLIQRLEEYLDPLPLIKASKASLIKKKKSNSDVHENSISNFGPGTVVVITGASSGIGEHIAYEYAKKGCSVVLAGRRTDKLKNVAQKCQDCNPHCRTLAVPTDVSEKEQCEQLIKRAVEHFGRINRLFLNAGVSQSCPLVDTEPAVLKSIMDVNFFGAANTVHAALPHILNAKGGAKIAVISSFLGKVVAPNQAVYCASKWALHGFFGSLRCELAPTGISVTIVCPGPVKTEILGKLHGPNATRIGFDISNVKQIMPAEKAAKLAITACERGDREIIYGKTLNKLAKLSANNPEQVDQILSNMYNEMHKNRITH